MRQSVRDAFVAFTSPLEGVVSFMYCDVKGLVTTAIGNLVDPISYALPLPFQRLDGTPATKSEIAADWERVKARQDLKLHGGMAYRSVAQLRLTPDGISQIVLAKLAQNVVHLRGRFPEWDAWPADAQLATLSMAWACGPAFRFTMLETALRARKFDMAALECRMQEKGNAGIVPRNIANRVLYRNAHHVTVYGLDPDALYYPRDLTAAPVDREAETQPDLQVIDLTQSEPPPSPTRFTNVTDLREAMQADTERHRQGYGDGDDGPPEAA